MQRRKPQLNSRARPEEMDSAVLHLYVLLSPLLQCGPKTKLLFDLLFGVKTNLKF